MDLKIPRAAEPAQLQFFNGVGGFSADGREYVTSLTAEQPTPAPWINVISNPQFGFQVAVEGGGYTWSVNSRENQLTHWSNDPVVDRPGEVPTCATKPERFGGRRSRRARHDGTLPRSTRSGV